MGERKIKVAFIQISRIVMVSASVSFLCSILFWKHTLFSLPYAILSIAVSFFLLLLLFQLRFLPQMTVIVWTYVWGLFGPFLMGSLFTLPQLPMFPLFALLFFLTISIGIWAALARH